MLRPALILACTALMVTPAAAQNRDNAGTPLGLGRTINGALTDAHPTLNDGTHFDCYRIQTSPGQRIQIDQTSDAFDPYLVAGSGSCGGLTGMQHDDDGGDGLNARLVLEGTGGVIYVFANSAESGATGAYQIRASLAGAAPTVTRLNVGQTASGTLSASDPTLPDNSYFDCFSVQTRAGQRLQIDQSSSDFDSYVSVGSGSCERLTAAVRDDDSGGGLNARVIHEGDGSVLFIQANSVGAGETGAYQLRVSVADGAAPASGGGSGSGELYGNVDPRVLATSRPTSLPAATSDWDTAPITCFSAYSAMVAMVAEGTAPREWGNVGQIDYGTRHTQLRSRVDFNDPEAQMIEFYANNFKSMSLVGSIGLAPNGQPNHGQPLAEYLTALGNCDRANNFTPVTRY
mgnify:FL=1